MDNKIPRGSLVPVHQTLPASVAVSRGVEKRITVGPGIALVLASLKYRYIVLINGEIRHIASHRLTTCS